MTVYDTFTVWAGGYDQFDDYREDLPVSWGLTGVLAVGEIVPTSGISATFTPAPILGATGAITASYFPSGLADSTGILVVHVPELDLALNTTPGIAVAFGPLTYTPVYSNGGDAATAALIITAAVPANTDYASCQPSLSRSQRSGIVTWQRAGLDTQASDVVTMVVQVHRNPGHIATGIAIRQTIQDWRRLGCQLW